MSPHLDGVFWACAAVMLAFLVVVVFVAAAGTGQDRRFNRALDAHHARTGQWPTLADLARRPRPRGRDPELIAPEVYAAMAEQGRQLWGQMDCRACDISIQVTGTAEEIEGLCDWHNRTYHGPTRPRPGTTLDRAA